MTENRPPVLISSAELAERLAGGTDGLVLADVRWTLGGPPGEPEFEAGHLPGAVWVDLEHELSAHAGDGGRHPLPDPDVFGAAMRRIGVDAGSDVVVYDGASSLAAARLWWLLTDAGHTRVRVLDGGYAGWVAEDRPVRTGPAAPARSGTFEPRPGGRRTLDAAEIRAAVEESFPELVEGRPSTSSGNSGSLTLVDVRAAERFTGAVEPYDPVAGHIPGAVNRPSTANLDASSHFRPAAEIAAAYADLADPVLYCGSGITAAHALLALESAGRTDGRIYPGSWSDWVRDPGRPVATGE
jgi:thiosulfate/3-mercaptopyruvate sulfurtransferase